MFFPTWRSVPGAYSEPFCEKLWNQEHPEKVVSLKKEAERGWKSGATPLSWKSGWKPSTRREFWAQRGFGSFFRFRDMAVWSWFFCAIKFYIVIFRLCSNALYSTWYSRGLTAVALQWIVCLSVVLFTLLHPTTNTTVGCWLLCCRFVPALLYATASEATLL